MATDTRKSTEVFFCAPAWDVVKGVTIDEPKLKRFPLLAHVRVALANVRSNEERYNKMTSYFHGGDITGNLGGDKLFLAQQIVVWEAEDERPALNIALTERDIKLSAVANSIVKELKRTLFTIERGTITGQITHTG